MDRDQEIREIVQEYWRELSEEERERIRVVVDEWVWLYGGSA